MRARGRSIFGEVMWWGPCPDDDLARGLPCDGWVVIERAGAVIERHHFRTREEAAEAISEEGLDS